MLDSASFEDWDLIETKLPVPLRNFKNCGGANT